MKRLTSPARSFSARTWITHGSTHANLERARISESVSPPGGDGVEAVSGADGADASGASPPVHPTSPTPMVSTIQSAAREASRRTPVAKVRPPSRGRAKQWALAARCLATVVDSGRTREMVAQTSCPPDRMLEESRSQADARPCRAPSSEMVAARRYVCGVTVCPAMGFPNHICYGRTTPHGSCLPRGPSTRKVEGDSI